MSFTASLLLSVALMVQPDSGLRLVNPHYVAVDATLSCGETQRTVRLEPHEIRDLTAQALCAAPLLHASLPLLAFETDGDAKQRILGTDESCAPVTMAAPLFGCERGTATASVPLLAGATYAWTAEGATITAGAGTNRVTATLGDAGSAKLVCTVTHAGCSSEAVGVIAIRKPLLIHELKVPAEVDAAQPVTITWSYEPGAVPNAQLLTGDAFTSPVALDGAQRSYTFTPATDGSRNVELLASYAPSIHPPAASQGRRRAVGSTLATATQCPSARATAKLEIRGCALNNLDIVAPGAVESGSTFVASVELNAGDGVEWQVTNGTLVSSNGLPQVEIRADDFAPSVRIAARVAHSDECWVKLSVDVAVHPRAACGTNPPTATLSVTERTCFNATVQAAFTGTPPFSGWLDGAYFETSSATFSQLVAAPGTYGIVGFRDSICSGVVDNLIVENTGPDAVLTTVGGSCTNSKIVATLTGRPPFKGLWSDGETFTTSEYTVEKTNLPYIGRYWIHALEDATCWVPARESYVEITSPPGMGLATGPFCQYDGGEGVSLPITVYEGLPPYSVEWSDGVVTTSNSTHFSRVFTDRVSTQVEIVRATTRTCDANVFNPVATIHYRHEPVIDESTLTPFICYGETGSAELTAPVPEGTIEWTITHGTILTGQGTSAITFKAVDGDPILLNVSVSYPDGHCTRSAGRGILVGETAGAITELTAEPSIIPAGSTTTISYKVVGNVNHWTHHVDPPSREGDLRGDRWKCNADRVCTIPFTDTHGAGTVTINVTYGGDCIQDGQISTTFTIGQ